MQARQEVIPGIAELMKGTYKCLEGFATHKIAQQTDLLETLNQFSYFEVRKKYLFKWQPCSEISWFSAQGLSFYHLLKIQPQRQIDLPGRF